MTRVQATVILPVRNGAATIGEQLAALAAQDFAGPWELIVIDNGSTDDTRCVIEAWRSRLPNMHLVDQPDGGYARACNIAAATAMAPRLLFCESDDVIGAGWVRAMVDALDGADLVGGRLEFGRLNAPAVRASRRPIQSKGLPTLFGYLPYSFGATLGVAASAFEAIGGFDESFSGGALDVDLCWRVQLLGGEIRFAPGAVVHYRLRSTLSGLMKQQYRYAREDECLYAKFRRLGVITMRPVARYRNAAFNLLALCRGIGALGVPNRRWEYLAAVSHCAGRFAGIGKARLLPSLRRSPTR